MITAVEWVIIGIILAAFFCGMVVFTTNLGYEASCGFYRYAVRTLRRFRRTSHWLTDEELQRFLDGQSADQDS
jgi:hypothetical protein